MVSAKYLSAEIIERQRKKCPAKGEEKRTRVQTQIGQNDSESAYIHFVCLLNHSSAGLIWKAA